MSTFLEIRDAKDKGRGVFARKDFAAGDVIEECPVIVLTEAEDKDVQKTILGRYVYEWEEKTSAVVLGYGSIFNHSYSPNAQYTRNFKKNLLVYTAIKDIPAGTEIVVNYNGDPHDKAAVDDFVPV